MYPVRTPRFVKSLFPDLIWDKQGDAKNLYLTFDDGPTPDVTEFVLDTLAQFNAKASFFCIGRNIVQNREIFQSIKDADHSIGNHTYNHLNGWRTDSTKYLNDIEECQRLVGTDLFRPPYGRITPKQASTLAKSFQVIMWDVLSGDFDRVLTPEKCTQNVLDHARPGSIIVFHDSKKAETKLRYALPLVLQHFTELGYAFRSL